jgi:signal peptide peptidase SppA
MRIHIAFVSPEHCDFAAELSAAARLEPGFNNALVGARYGMGPTGKPFAFSGGVAVIPVHGLLLNRFPGSVGMATGYDFVRGQLRTALADPDVSRIVFDIHSNGGMAAGCEELAQEIYRSRESKPSLAVVDSNSYSGAYYLGSAASRIVSTVSGGIGSIGVVAMHVDHSKLLEDAGVSVTFIQAGDEKVDGNAYQPLSERARERINSTVQYHYGLFTEAVAKFRGIPVADVRATEARCYTPPEALELGLIDGIVDATDAVRGMLDNVSEGQMEISQEDIARIATEAASRAVAEDRNRMSAIRNSPHAKGREKLADHLALNTSMGAEEAAAILEHAPRQEEEKPNGFAAAMDAGGNPNVGPDNPANTSDPGADVPNRILANYKALTGYDYRKSA